MLRTLSLAALLALGLAGPSDALAKGKEIVVYVNGTDATGIKDVEFKAVDVRIDSNGNVWIDAPRYRIQVNKPAGTEPAAAAAAPTTPTTGAVPAGRHWLVTQDTGSTGQAIEVLVNGTSVREIRSGQAQLILDIGPWLQPGSNVVTFRPIGDAAAAGSLKIHLGLGTNESGTLKLDNPQLTWDTATSTSEKSVEYVAK